MKNIFVILVSFLITWYLFHLNKQWIQVDISDIKYLKFEVSDIDRILILFLSMFVGILSKTFHSELNKKNQSENILLRVLKSKGLYNSFFISPIIFFTIYTISDSQPDDLISSIVSFQTGFFWRSIVEN